MRLKFAALIVQGVSRKPLPLLLLLLAALSVAFSVVARASGVSYESIFGLTSLFRLASTAPFFVVGIIMYSNMSVKQLFFKTPIWLGVAAVPLATYAHEFTRNHGLVVGEIALYIEQLLVIGRAHV